MKNIPISIKLWLIIVPAIISLVGLLYYFSYRSNRISTELSTLLYDELYVNSSKILNADRDFYQAAIAEKELVLSQPAGDERQALVDAFHENTQQVLEERISSAMESLKGNTALYSEFVHPTGNVTLEELYADFKSNFSAWQNSYDPESGNGDLTAHNAYFDAAREDINLMTELLDEYAKAESAAISEDIRQSIRVSVLFILAVTLMVLIFAVLMIRYFQTNIKYITKVSQRIAGGELSLQVEEKRMSRDEIGRLCSATGQILNQLNAYVSYINEVTLVLNKMADGHMRIQLAQDYSGQFKPIKDAIERFSASMDKTLLSIRSTAEAVKNGASAIASGAQNLSQGTAEQASTVEELSASLEEVSSQTNLNARNAEAAKELANTAKAYASTGKEQMDEMLAAMDSINASSSSINKIIKVIEDIAFQTNILALNAAVEAARAGAHGKGFAVVAQEVKTLAARSSTAASETTDMLEDSIRKIEAGTNIARETADALRIMIDEIDAVASNVSSIAGASKEQALGIDQINQGLVQVSQVVQANAATSEENAATSEELSTQADLLFHEVSRFVL
jgi:methyl-accepting chemotaxis protein